MGRGRRLTMAVVAVAMLAGCSGEPAIPDVVGEDLSFARGAMASSNLEYEVNEVEVDSPDEAGVVQDAYREEESVILEVGTLPVITLTGDFTLTEPGFGGAEGGACSGSGGYSDFRSGMNVTVRDGDGNIVGSTSTGAATYVDSGSGLDALYCRTSFEVEVDIVDFYAIEIGRRGELSYSYEDLESQDFQVSLTLGD